ncbi:FAD-dependent oxidoreductase, partial [Rhizobium sp. 18055]|uniref:FAD-dependent oxidoreductase n=1 Tax=Rhizobium sp. 18055 TaxID=2681403 RepID=UPI00190F3AE9
MAAGRLGARLRVARFHALRARLEPALAAIRPRLAGATYTAEDESGDANAFTRALAQVAEAHGVRFRMGCHVTALRTAGGAIDHVEITDAE